MTTMLGQAEATRSAVGLAHERAVLAACNVVHAVAAGAKSDRQLQERADRTARLVDTATELEREQTAILEKVAEEDECRATSGLASTQSVWAATSEGLPDPVARTLQQRLAELADRAMEVATAANKMLGELPRALGDIRGAPPQGRRRGRSRMPRPLSTAHREA